MKNVYSVSWVNAYLKDMISNDILLKSLYVKGEASNVKYHSSGHLYFTLKEKDAIIQCAMFSGYQKKGLCFRLKDGDEVIVRCSVDLYEKGGTYKLKVTEMYPTGAGKINEAYEKLKAELEEMGMFDPCYKRELPEYVNRIGVVAAYPGEAVHDIIENATKRNPYIEILVYPSYVQGEQAVQSIVNGIHALEKMEVDTIILGRGGGSVEDLWAFNERLVAETIFNCEIPIISAIGHEKQVPIADLVADVRVSTPTAAAVAATQDVSEIFLQFEAYERRCFQIMSRKVGTMKMQLLSNEKRLQSLSPKNKLKEQKIRLRHYEERLEQNMKVRLEKDQYRLQRNTDMLERDFERCLEQYKHHFAILAGKMEAVSPLKRLASGYAFVKNEEGKKISSASQLHMQDVVSLHYLDGFADALIKDVHMNLEEKNGNRTEIEHR